MSTTKTTSTTINSWGEVKQKLFFGDKEIVNASKRIVPKENAHVLTYTTKDGVEKKFYFADEVAVLDTEGIRLKQQAERDLFRRYMKHEISHEQLIAAVAELNG